MCIVWEHSIFPTQFLGAVRSPFIKPSHFSSFEMSSCWTTQPLSTCWFRVYQTSKDYFPQFLSKVNSCDQTKRSFDFSLSWWISILIWFSVIADLIFRDRHFCIASINESFRIFSAKLKVRGFDQCSMIIHGKILFLARMFWFRWNRHRKQQVCTTKLYNCIIPSQV